MNFWVANPYVAQNDNTNDNSWGNYNGLQAEVHQRMKGGATFTGTYTWSHALTDMPSQSTASGNVLNYTTIRNFRLDKAPLSNDRRQATASMAPTICLSAPARSGSRRAPCSAGCSAAGSWVVSPRSFPDRRIC